MVDWVSFRQAALARLFDHRLSPSTAE